MKMRFAGLRVYAAGILVTAGCGGGPTTPQSNLDQAVSEVPARLPPLTPLEIAVKHAFLQTLNEQVYRPAIFDSNLDIPFCSRYVTSNAYLGSFGRLSTLLTVNLSSDGTSVTKNTRTSVLTPAGRLRVLTVLVDHPQTVGADAISLLESAQRAINDDHAAFAVARGYSAPIVTFDNTNVRIESSQIAEPRASNLVQQALSARGISAAGYDFLVSININPDRSEGGFAQPGSVPAFIYMGNFGQWRTLVSAANMNAVVGAVYHHEVIHHWGWPALHDWGCANTTYEFNFRVKPVLLGWEDVDGDRVPEILDQTPYARSHR